MTPEQKKRLACRRTSHDEILISGPTEMLIRRPLDNAAVHVKGISPNTDHVAVYTSCSIGNYTEMVVKDSREETAYLKADSDGKFTLELNSHPTPGLITDRKFIMIDAEAVIDFIMNNGVEIDPRDRF